MILKTFEISKYCLENHPRDDIFCVKKNSSWIKYSTQDYLEYSTIVAVYLMSMGLKKGDRIASFNTNNTPEWNFIDVGMSMLGIIHVPIHLSFSKSELDYILNQIKAKYVFVSDEKTYKDVSESLNVSHSLEQILSFESVQGIPNWEQIIEKGKEIRNQYEKEVLIESNAIRVEDPVTLLYTSGTTGKPKGVLLNHKNLVSNLISASYLQPLGYNDKALSFLPLSHIYERTSNYQFQYSGCSIYYAESVPKVLENIQELRPEGFCAVPRVLEKIRNLYFERGRDLRPIKRKIFEFSNRLVDKYPVDHKISPSYRIRRAIADLFVFRKFRHQLGGKIKFIGCGGAKLNPNVELFFWTAKLPVYQGYGLTETSPLISLNTYLDDKNRIGSIGPIIPEVSVKIAQDGEILCKGPNVMLGYYNNSEETHRVIDENGWFHTGDVGKLSTDNFLYIKGRKKSIFKTSYGKYVSPIAIESLFRESNIISQLVALGEYQKFVSALIQPDFENLISIYQSTKTSNYIEIEELVNRPDVLQLYQDEINKLNKKLSKHEQVKKFYLVTDEWSVQTGELSQSLKLRRFFIHDKYRKIIHRFYEE